MTKKERDIILKIIKTGDFWINECSCGYRKKAKTFCEMYGCSNIDKLIKPLKELLRLQK